MRLVYYSYETNIFKHIGHLGRSKEQTAEKPASTGLENTEDNINFRHYRLGRNGAKFMIVIITSFVQIRNIAM